MQRETYQPNCDIHDKHDNAPTTLAACARGSFWSQNIVNRFGNNGNLSNDTICWSPAAVPRQNDAPVQSSSAENTKPSPHRVKPQCRTNQMPHSRLYRYTDDNDSQQIYRLRFGSVRSRDTARRSNVFDRTVPAKKTCSAVSGICQRSTSMRISQTAYKTSRPFRPRRKALRHQPLLGLAKLEEALVGSETRGNRRPFKNQRVMQREKPNCEPEVHSLSRTPFSRISIIRVAMVCTNSWSWKQTARCP